MICKLIIPITMVRKTTTTVARKSVRTRIKGGSGKDRITNTGHTNKVTGGSGRDKISSKGYGNFVTGGRGHDSIRSSAAKKGWITRRKNAKK